MSEPLGKKKTIRIQPGMIFDRLTVICLVPGTVGPYRMCVCSCSCGATKIVRTNNLGRSNKNYNTRSCGCLRKEITSKRRMIHGHSLKEKRSRAYSVWANMKTRCNNPKSRYYKNYGGRGIKVCSQWENSFDQFFKDMGEPPEKSTIDRIDNDKGYELGNCRWANRKTQARNKRTTRLLTFNGQTRSMAEWSEILGISYTAIYLRIKRYKWTVERTLSTP